jgi:hypothetical protein
MLLSEKMHSLILNIPSCTYDMKEHIQQTDSNKSDIYITRLWETSSFLRHRRTRKEHDVVLLAVYKGCGSHA